MYKNEKKIENRTIQTAVCFVLISIAQINAFYSFLSMDSTHHPYETIFYNIFLMYSIAVIVVLLSAIIGLIEQGVVDVWYKFIIIAILSVIVGMLWDLTFWNGVDCIMRKNLINEIYGI